MMIKNFKNFFLANLADKSDRDVYAMLAAKSADTRASLPFNFDSVPDSKTSDVRDLLFSKLNP